jgi:adenylyltransferase/sulfurtransferase
VREDYEWQIAHIAGARHIPLAELSGRVSDLDPGRPIVTYCHHGLRSLQAAEILRAAGCTEVRSLVGGIDAWARDVSPGTARY